MSPAKDQTPPSHEIDIQWGIERPASLPGDKGLASWVMQTLDHLGSPPSEVSIRMMSVDEITELNTRYRERPAATNVLSFPAGEVVDDGRRVLGDIAICLDVVSEEAGRQEKSLEAHLAHMLVHGVLHLMGLDHMAPEEAEEMEAIEVEIMADLGFADPYDE